MERHSGPRAPSNAPVEILMAVYNGEAFLSEQIDSILAQSDPRWHLTLSDDGSTDRSPEIIDGYAARHPDRIARHRSGRQFGSARDHFFYLMGRSRAHYLLFCDQDDVWAPEKVARTRQALEAAEARRGADTPILVFSDQTPTDARLNPLAPSLMRYQKQYFGDFDYRAILMQNVVTGGAMGINRALADLGGRGAGVPEVLMHDWWLAAAAARFGEIVYIDQCLGVYRQHGENEVGAKHVGSAGYVLNRLGRLQDVRRTILGKKAQAGAFLGCYGDALGPEDAAFLRGFARSRSGPGFYLKYGGLIHGAARKLGMLALG